MWYKIIKNMTRVPIPVQQEQSSYSIRFIRFMIYNLQCQFIYYVNYQQFLNYYQFISCLNFIIVRQNYIANSKKIMSYSKNNHQTTILVQGNNKELSSDHPLFYVQAKNYFLEQLSNKVSVENRLGTMDLKRNVRIGQFVQRHDQINKQIQKQKRLSKTYLKADEFQSVLVGDQQKIKRDREIKETQKLREKLYECYIQEKNMHQQPQRDTANNDYQEWKMSEQNKGAGNFTILSNYRDDPKAKKQLYLLDLQISKIREQQNRDLQFKNKMESCTNNKLLQKVSNSIMSSFMVYFDQIWDVLIDQILEEEVCFLNKLQAEYYLNQTQKDKKNQSIKNQNDSCQNARVLKMMQLVRQLDELAD